MTIGDILRDKGGAVHTISPDATLDDAVQRLVRQNVGSLVVCVQGDCAKASSIVGIITERDVLRASAARVGVFTDRLVSDVMTTGPVTGTPRDDAGEVMGLMTDRRIRHLPIIDEAEDRLVGIVSLGDLVKAQN
ncbi:MAG: CBS domain-containing protein, partial [Verrucomicrobiae bacterium]|nr:CBS domain-containing protein [Verrucomicrobiae bacterium]